jgi:IPT/TIG domain
MMIAGKAQLLILILSSIVFAQDNIRRNFSWTLEGKNDPILQVKNESDKAVTVQIRLVFEDDIYRYPQDLEIPSGESRFLRIREALERLGRRYSDLLQMTSGTLQIQFAGDKELVEASMVNLNPKMGITGAKSAGASAPVIKSIEPNSGAPSGGTVVTIAGENFNEATTIKFGGVSAMRNLQSSDVLIAIAPPHSPGTVDVEISNGKSRSGLRKAFTYASANPVIVRVDPDSGPVTGGAVSIRGRNFQQGAKVMWDSRPLQARFVNDQELSTTAPAHPRGSITVEVLNPDGSRFELEDAFQYAGAPRVISVQPQMGSPEGGYTVTVSGENFDPGCSVLFGGSYGETTFVNPRVLAAIAPDGDSGPVDVSVTTEEGESDTLQNAFLYNDPPTIISMTAAPNPIVRNTTTTITVEADDPEAGGLNYEYRVAQGTGSITGQGRTAIYKSPNTTGITVIQVTVYDQHRAKAQQNLEIHVE